MPTKFLPIHADNIDDAAEQIITKFLVGKNKEGDTIYFLGWFALWGASSALKAVVRRLRSSPAGWADNNNTGATEAFEKIIHIDFSRWQGKRGLQKAIAEELELPPQVMAIFGQCDEDDDFDGVEQIARGVIPEVKLAIMNELIARRFLVVFHNASGNYIDLWEVGVPVIGKLSKMVLWTSQGRFWSHATARHLKHEYAKELAGLSDVAIMFLPSGFTKEHEDSMVRGMKPILHEEAEEVAKCTGYPEPDMSPQIVKECILYMALIGKEDQSITWESHASNYWVCDGIIQDATNGGRSAWEISNALKRNVGLDICTECAKEIHELLIMGDEHLQRRSDCWVSATSQNSRRVQVPSHATSFFWTTAGPSSGDHNTSGRGRVLEASMFEHSPDRCSSLRVMHLSHCTFSFSSPPFLSCSNLRFLLLDHCKDKDDDAQQDHISHSSRQDGTSSCFRNLWVLELSYTDWYWLISKDMLDLMTDLRELNVKGVGNWSISHLHRCSGAASNVCKLQVVAKSDNKDDDGDGGASFRNEQAVAPIVVAPSSFPDLSSWHNLKTVILDDGCGDLELINCNALPLQSLESFTWITSVTASSKTKSISFRGCGKLKHVLLRGLFDSLLELDMSGTAIKTLDLSATQAMGLRRLFLSGCGELRAILWPSEKEKIRLEVLCIDTTTTTTHATWDSRGEEKIQKQDATASDDDTTSIGSSSSAAAAVCSNAAGLVDSYISVRDPRLFRSLWQIRHVKGLHVEISSASSGHKGTTPGQGIGSSGCGGGGGDKQQLQKPYAGGGNYLYLEDIINSSKRKPQAASGAQRDLFEASSSSSAGAMWMWHCPPIPEDSDWARCYISIQDHTKLLQGATTTTRQETMDNNGLPPFVHKGAKTLHLHDSFSVTRLPGETALPLPARVKLGWYELRWCRLERCPNLGATTVFTPPIPKDDENNIFQHLETFWASQLMKARYIWNWKQTVLFHPGPGSFENLVFLHLDDCPRLVHVLPLNPSNTRGCRRLETLEIVCCGNLREVFPSSDDEHPAAESQQQQQGQEEQPEPREFPSLKRIHLYELPKLQHICGRRMFTPNLETVKIRGCWSLKRLPSVQPTQRQQQYVPWLHPHHLHLHVPRRIRRRRPPPTVDCEKDWWERLEWDGEADGHHPFHYKLTHSAYWNKTRLRTSLLR